MKRLKIKCAENLFVNNNKKRVQLEMIKWVKITHVNEDGIYIVGINIPLKTCEIWSEVVSCGKKVQKIIVSLKWNF